jgi:creatinine amidohydrolase
VLLNGHGGNSSVLQAALRELHPKTPAFIALAEWFGAIGEAMAVLTSEERGHACEMETSTMLYLCPEGVDMTAAETTHSRPTVFSNRALSFVSPWHAYTRNTGLGDPTVATAEKGERMIAAALDRLATALKELSAAPYTDLFPFVE